MIAGNLQNLGGHASLPDRTTGEAVNQTTGQPAGGVEVQRVNGRAVAGLVRGNVLAGAPSVWPRTDLVSKAIRATQKYCPFIAAIIALTVAVESARRAGYAVVI